ncbi:ATP-binding protein [Kordiimonas aestuarii]|uniref:ATP-binding protein n=1 Tax=Kordiimonas aestuarii TaxID=1005925 RepID=UPI0021D0CC23|nr:ATP-binding protein [Kordiimonas aestuarii]
MIEATGRFFRSLTGRLLLSAILWSAAALAVGGMLLSFAFRTYVLTDIDRKLEMMIDTMVGISEISPEGVLRFNQPLLDQRFAAPYSGWYWQISELDSQPFRSRSLWDFELAPDLDHRAFSLKLSEVPGPDGQDLRVAERDIILPEADRIFRYQVATDTGEVRDAIARFNWLLMGALAFIMFTVSLALVIQVAYGLRPLRNLRRSLTAVRSGHKERIDGDWPEDLRPLAQEINALIDQNEKLVDRARTHVGNLAHALKTPLSVIMNEVENDTSKKGQAIALQAKNIREHVDHHLKRARIAGGGSGPGLPIRERMEKVARAIARLNRDKDLEVTVSCPEDLKFDGEKEDFDEILGNIVDNAGKWASSVVTMTAQRTEENLRRPYMDIRVEDDGPGVPAEERETLFERGKRLDEHVPGTGLGLAIVRDIVELYGGTAYLDEAKLGGLAVVMRLPAK